MLTENYVFSDPTQYTFDPELIVLSGGNAELKNLIPLDMTFFASYVTGPDADFAQGVPTGTLTGMATVSNGFLNVGAGADGCQYSWTGDFDIDNSGALRYRFTPNYSGNPSARTLHFCSGHTTPPYPNHMELSHYTDGTFNLYLSDNLGNVIVNGSFGAWNPTAETEYEFELDIDCVNGVHRLFINGILFGILFGTGSRDASGATGWIIGNDLESQTYGANGKFRNVQLYNDVQHVTNYTPSVFYIYSSGNPSITGNIPVQNQGIVSFFTTITASGGDAVKYTISQNGIFYWWNGTAWVISDGSYAQSNIAADINVNMPTFSYNGISTQFTAFLHSGNGLTTPALNSVQINYNPCEFSSIDQMRKNLIQIDSTRLSDALVLDRIAHADDDVMMDLSKYVNFNNAVVKAGFVDKSTTPLFPVFLNHMSQYMTCVHVLAKLYGAKRTADEISDIQYWEKEYDKLLQRVKTNQTPIALTDGTDIGFGTFKISTSNKNIRPALGEGKYGEYISKTELAKQRAEQPNGISSIVENMED